MTVTEDRPREMQRPLSGDAALWAAAASSEDTVAFAEAWLALLGRSVPPLVQAVLFLDPDRAGQMQPLTWQIFRQSAAATRDVFEPACRGLLAVIVSSRSPLVDFKTSSREPTIAGWPVVIGGVVCGAVIVEATVPDEVSAKRLIRQLQWGSAWIEAHLMRRSAKFEDAGGLRARKIIDAASELANERHFTNACTALAAYLARSLACHRVSVGMRDGAQSRLIAVSQSAAFDQRSELARTILSAMDEAIDQRHSLVAPLERGHIAPAQQYLLQTTDGAGVLTLPMTARGETFGAIALERRAPATPFTRDEIDLAEAIVAVVETSLDDKRLLHKSLFGIAAERARDFSQKALGPSHFGTKFAVLAGIATLLFLAFATGEYRITAKVQVQGEQRRLVGAPFDGFIKSQFARAGEIVREGMVLAQLEDNDLTLDRLKLTARQRQYQLELERALAKREMAAVSIAQAQIEQTLAEIELADQMLARTRIKVPFDSVVVSGDLSQSIGRPVSRGDTLFELAPLDRYRVTALVPDVDMQFMTAGLVGQMRLAGLPEEPFNFEIATITPVGRVLDGVNGFDVLGPLLSRDPRIRPGMEGVAKIPVGRRHLVWIWTRELLTWLRVKIWTVFP